MCIRDRFGTGEIGVLIDGSWVYSTAVLADPSVEGDFAVADTCLLYTSCHTAGGISLYVLPAAYCEWADGRFGQGITFLQNKNYK